MIAGNNNSLAQIVKKAVYYFGIKDFTFLYRSNNITSNNLYKSFGYLPQIPYVIKDSVVICGRFDFSSVSKSMFTKAMTELFGINQMFKCQLCTCSTGYGKLHIKMQEHYFICTVWQ